MIRLTQRTRYSCLSGRTSRCRRSLLRRGISRLSLKLWLLSWSRRRMSSLERTRVWAKIWERCVSRTMSWRLAARKLRVRTSSWQMSWVIANHKQGSLWPQTTRWRMKSTSSNNRSKSSTTKSRPWTQISQHSNQPMVLFVVKVYPWKVRLTHWLVCSSQEMIPLQSSSRLLKVIMLTVRTTIKLEIRWNWIIITLVRRSFSLKSSFMNQSKSRWTWSSSWNS